eukprot:7434993-Ditylum_brightwellii.AAC.1
MRVCLYNSLSLSQRVGARQMDDQGTHTSINLLDLTSRKMVEWFCLYVSTCRKQAFACRTH